MFASKAQARFMYAKHPTMAKEFADKTPNMAALPERSGKKLKEMMMSQEAYRRMKKAH